MGFHRSSLVVAPLLLVLPVHAQDSGQSGGQGDPIVNLPSSTRPAASDPRRQGPEIDVFRDVPGTAAPATPPPLVVTPTVAPTPTQTRSAPVQSPRPQSAPAERQPIQKASDTERRQRPQPAPTAASQPAAPQPASSQPTRQQPGALAAPQMPDTQPTPAPDNATAPVAQTPAAAQPDTSSPVWPWVAVALVLIAGVAAFLFGRRRKAAQAEPVEPPMAAPPSRREPAIIPPAPEPALPPAPEVSPPVVEPVAATLAADSDRPWLDMQLDVTQARFSLVGVTIAYTLFLHNRGERPAQDVLVRGIVGNAGSQQQALLDGFFTGKSGMPLHSAVAILPGETQRLSGELRLAPDAIAPVQMGQRSLLIPVAAFDAAYRWGAEDAVADLHGGPQGNGRTARAFIVGQEQEPPADRLAPLRLDQGPRQYRRPAARAAAELTPS